MPKETHEITLALETTIGQKGLAGLIKSVIQLFPEIEIALNGKDDTIIYDGQEDIDEVLAAEQARAVCFYLKEHTFDPRPVIGVSQYRRNKYARPGEEANWDMRMADFTQSPSPLWTSSQQEKVIAYQKKLLDIINS